MDVDVIIRGMTGLLALGGIVLCIAVVRELRRRP